MRLLHSRRALASRVMLGLLAALSLSAAPVRGRAAIRAAYEGAGGPLRLRAFAFATSGGVGYILGGYGDPAAAAGEDLGKYTLTLRRVGDRWLIVSDMDNSNRRR